MGVLFSILSRQHQSSAKGSHRVRVVNQTPFDLVLWVGGGGPVLVAGAARGFTVPAKSEQDLEPYSIIGHWQATIAPSSHSFHNVLSSFVVWKGWLKSSDDPLVIDHPAQHDLPGFGNAPLVVFALIVKAQRAVRASLRDKARLLAAAMAMRRHNASRRIQRFGRAFLGRLRRECPICLEDLLLTELTRLATCQHKTCKACATNYVDTALSDSKWHVRCPMPACTSLLGRPDMMTHATPVAWEKHQSAVAAQHAQRLGDETDELFLEHCRVHTRRCPCCCVIIWRFEGCDHMTCRCGFSFRWTDAAARIGIHAAIHAS